MRDAAARWPDRPALVSGEGGFVTFGALNALSIRFACALFADGMSHGERIGIWANNSAEWVAAAVGAQRVGGVIVPLNTRLRGGEVADVARRAGLTRLIAMGDFLGQSYPAMLRDHDLGGVRRVIVTGFHAAPLVGIEESWSAFLMQGEGVSPEALAAREALVRPDTIADIMFTSGTTGAPKGAVFDHRRSIGGARAWRDITGMTEHDHYCCFGPFSHNASYKAGWVCSLLTGAALYWPEAYDSRSVLDLIARRGVTVMPAPPTIWQQVLDDPHRADWNISSLRFLSTGATVVPIELIRRLATETSIANITTGYGMTECCGSATHTRPGDLVERVSHTVGAAIPGTEIRIAGPDGRSLEIGETGEVMIRDDKLLIEYLDNPEETRRVFDQDGWLHTGDVGRLDSAGYLKISDRLKDMFIVGGFNVYPAEIERQMSVLSGLSQCAMIGVPDARLGEVGHVFVVRAPGSTLTAEEVLRWSKTNLAGYKVPRGVTFVDALPLNTTGKVMKPSLRALLG